METTEIKLTKPISWGSDTITSLSLREMKAKDLRKLSAQPSMSELLDMVSQLSGKPGALIDDLNVEDAMRCVEVVSSFFPNSQKTGMN
jgi:hypothetical protein